ncbi:hypothetical protein FF38_05197 [Lucilia cuprina]|uniref:Uncharacterized protein n=1 Tax=Lucilia cuprina TaxID=7375 RepID=A0A0L0CLE1_LUCCU|nr:hypothetical protein FF38_05197 [Lucilia cuprina]
MLASTPEFHQVYHTKSAFEEYGRDICCQNPVFVLLTTMFYRIHYGNTVVVDSQIETNATKPKERVPEIWSDYIQQKHRNDL